MEEEKKVRLSIEMTESEHKYLKMCCLKLGVSMKDFVINSTIDRVDLEEDKWMQPTYEARDKAVGKKGGVCIPTEELLMELGLQGAC